MTPVDIATLSISIVFLTIVIVGVILNAKENFGRCVQCRKLRKKHGSEWIDERRKDNNYKGYTFSYCRECKNKLYDKWYYGDQKENQYTMAKEYDVKYFGEYVKEYFFDCYKKNILSNKVKNAYMRKWIINIFLIGLFYEILTFAPRVLERLLR